MERAIATAIQEATQSLEKEMHTGTNVQTVMRKEAGQKDDPKLVEKKKKKKKKAKVRIP
jgi:hypothetical protein